MSESFFRWRPALQYKSLFTARGAKDPFKLFTKLFAEAKKALPMPESMTLATATKAGAPSARIVLLKGLDQGKFCFFTNYHSKKSKEMDQNPKAALLFFWEPLEIQVRVEGRIQKTTAAYSDAYWRTRPRPSQLGAWASDQSSKISSYKSLVAHARALEKKFYASEVPRPLHWGGYTLEPASIEFWFGRPNRLHERVLFQKTKGRWKVSNLAP